MLALLLAVVVGTVALAPGLPDLDPFERRTQDRSQPVVLRSLARLSEFRAATANLQVPVVLEEDVEGLPDFLAGERTLLLAAGTVDAAVAFDALGAGSVTVSEDRRAVAVRLPPARLSAPRLDLARSQIVDRERGLADRVGALFGEDLDEDRELLLLAERKLADAARADGGLAAAGERNTRTMLEGLLRGLGFERVDVRFGS